MANPFDQFDAPSGAPRLVPLGQKAPKEPSPQTPAQAQKDVLDVRRAQTDLATAPYDSRKAAADAERAEIEAANARREAQLRDSRPGPAPELVDGEGKLRGEFQKLEEAKRYSEVLPIFSAALRSADTKAGDLGLIYSFGKIMDPGSVVREGEMVMVQGTGQVQDRLRSLMSEVSGMGRISPETRKALLTELRSRASQFADAYNQRRSFFGDLAQSYGYDPERIIGPHPGAPYQQAEADFKGEPIVNLDGTLGARPRAGMVNTPGEVVFKDQMPEADPERRLTPEQQAAYDALVGSGANADQIRTFFQRIGFSAENADDVVSARDAGAGFVGADAAKYNPSVEAQRLLETRNQTAGPADASDLLISGAQLGLQDEAAGVGNSIANIISSPFTNQSFDPVGAYQAGKKADQMYLQQARDRTGVAGTAAEIGGSFLSGNVTNALAAAPNLFGRVVQGAKAGAAGGTVAGFGYGEGTNSLLTAGLGGATGGALGAALPVAGQLVRNRVDGFRRMTGRDGNLSRQVIADSVQADDGFRAAGQMMDEARGRGSPMMLADTGENSRELLASMGRQPGPSRKITVKAVVERQKEQFERVAEAVKRDLGPTVNLDEKGDELIEGAKKAAAPLYDEFYARPGASNVKLDDIKDRPFFRQALKRAHLIAKEEGRDPTALGFDLDDQAEVVLTRVNSFQTLDYVKRGMDDVIEAMRDPRTGKLKLDEWGRAANGTLRTLLARVDNATKDASGQSLYAAARAAYGGPASMKSAMLKGAKALNKQPDDVLAEIKNLNDGQKEMYRLGIRKAIMNLLASKKDGGDKVGALIGTPKSRAVLTRLFGGRAEFDRFIATLRDEEAMGATFKAVTGNSATARRMAQDAQTNDEGLAETAMDAVIRGGNNSLWQSTLSVLDKMRTVDKFGAGEAGQRTRESIAALLTETDPAVLQQLVTAARRDAARARAMQKPRSRAAVNRGRNAGNVSGMTIGRLSTPTER